jgi:hypothetical protein
MTDRNRIILICTATVLLCLVLFLIAARPTHAAAPPGTTMYTLKTWVVSVTPQPDSCKVVVAAGMNGTVLYESGAICAAKRNARVTLNYVVGSKTVRAWNRLTRKMLWQSVPTYTYSNYFMGWAGWAQ